MGCEGAGDDKAPGSRPDIISGGADSGLLRPPVCVACGRALSEAEAPCDPASEAWAAAPEPAGAAQAWFERLDREGASLAYYVGLCGWLAAHPAHLDAYVAQADRHVPDPLKPLRRR